jgi:hypothetical protein
MKQAKRYIFLFLLIGGLAVNCKSPDTDVLSRYLPLEVNGWTVQGEDSLFDSETISNYIDRAGEVYRAYDFQRLLTRLYKKEGQPVIHVDFFDMGSAKNAFGIFSFNPDGEEVGVGQGSTQKGGLLVFWKDRYFVSLYAESDTQEARETLLVLGKDVASAIEREGQIPAIVARLPEDNLIPRGIHYFFSHLILNYFSFFSGGNILELGEDTPAVMGRYLENDEVYSLLLVDYVNEIKASAALNSFMNSFLPEGFEPGIFQTEAGKWMGVQTSGKLLMILWNGPSQEKTEELFLKVNKTG